MNAPRRKRAAISEGNTYGPPELCAWQVEAGTFWIQTTQPQFSRKLEKRQDMRRVEMTGVDHFRRTFETRGTWRKIRRIIDRFLVSAGDQVSWGFWLQGTSKPRMSISIAAGPNRCRRAILVTGGAR